MRKFTIDIGGEGRHPGAWNLNPSRVRTVGPQSGQPIPHLIAARANGLPFVDASVPRILVERTPMPLAALKEIRRVIAPGGLVVFRHVKLPWGDRHALAKQALPGRVRTRFYRSQKQVMQETAIRIAKNPRESP